MKIENKEIAKFDLTECPAETDAVLHLSAADDPRWAGIVTLAPSHVYTLPALSRHDIYVLHGSVKTERILLDKDGFASLCDAGELRAGSEASGCSSIASPRRCTAKRYVHHVPRFAQLDFDRQQRHTQRPVRWIEITASKLPQLNPKRRPLKNRTH